MRKTSHFQKKEPLFENILQWLRFSKVASYIKNNSELLDMGCGYQMSFLYYLDEKIKRGVGIDVSVNKNKKSKNINYFISRVDQKINAPVGKFDCVTSLAVIEHVTNPGIMLKEAYRLLRKDGVLIITTPSKYAKPILEFLSFKLHLVSPDEISDHKRYYDIDSLKKEIVSAGFKKDCVKTKYFQCGVNILAIAVK